jgi:hypothetical protein
MQAVCSFEKICERLITLNFKISVSIPNQRSTFKDTINFAENIDKNFKNQYNNFKTILNNHGKLGNFVRNDQKNYFARGHLVPNADGRLIPMRTATFYYQNAIPQWQSINVGNWRMIEDALRENLDNVEVETGVFGSFTLKSTSGNVNVQLSTRGNRVPLWIYKKIRLGSQEVLIVILNNAQHENYQSLTDFNPNPCYEIPCPPFISVLNKDGQFSDYKKGYTFCASSCNLVHKRRHSFSL